MDAAINLFASSYQVIIPNGNDDDEKHEEEIHNGNSEALATLDHEVYIKHPLHHTWVMWYFKQEKGRDWSDSQRKIAAVSTAEDFWAYVATLNDHFFNFCIFASSDFKLLPMN